MYAYNYLCNVIKTWIGTGDRAPTPVPVSTSETRTLTPASTSETRSPTPANALGTRTTGIQSNSIIPGITEYAVIRRETESTPVSTAVDSSSAVHEHKRNRAPVRVKCEVDQIKELLADNFTCAICLDILKKPLIAEDCGHVFCKICLNNWLYNHQTCPQCRQLLLGYLKECKLLEKIISVMTTTSTLSTTSALSTTPAQRRQITYTVRPNCPIHPSMFNVQTAVLPRSNILSKRPPWK